MAPIDGFEGPGGRGFGPGGGLPDAAAWQERLREMAARLAEALKKQQSDAAVETARVLHEAARLPDAARQSVLTAVVGEAVRDPASALRERVDAAFPEGSETRQRLGESLARLGGEDPRGWSRTALEAKVTSALASLGPRSEVRTAVGDRIERARGFGPFGSGPGAVATPAVPIVPAARPLEAAPTFSAAPSSPVAVSSHTVPSTPATASSAADSRVEARADVGAEIVAGSARRGEVIAESGAEAVAETVIRADVRSPTWSRVDVGATISSPPTPGAARPEARPARFDSDSAALEAALGGGTAADVATAPTRQAPVSTPASPTPPAPSITPVSPPPPLAVQAALGITEAPLLRTLTDGLRQAAPAFIAQATGEMKGAFSALAQKALSAREALWTHGERDAVVRYGADLADEHVGGLFETLGQAQQTLGLPTTSVSALRSALSTLRGGAASARGEASAAALDLQPVVSRASGGGVRTALHDVRDVGRWALRLEGELRMTDGKAAMLAGLEPATSWPGDVQSSEGGGGVPPHRRVDEPPTPTTDSPAALGVPEEGEFTLTEDDLARLGSGLDPTKPPPQTLWSEELVNSVCDLGRQRGGVTDAEGQEHFLLAGRLLEGAGEGAVPLGAAEIAAALKAAGVPLEKVDPGQLEAASRYVSAATSGAEQQERLRKTLDSFTVLSRTGFPPLPRQEMVEHLWAIAKVPGHALQKLSDTELQAKFQEVLAAVNSGPGQAQIKVGDHNLKFTVGANGTVTGSETKKPGFFSKLGGFIKKVAPIALTVLSFIPVTAPFARIAQGAISLVRSIRSKSLLGAATAVAGMVAGGATALAGKGAEAASSAAAQVARVANGVARGLQGVSSVRQGSVLGGLASIGSGVAGAIGSAAEGTATGLQRFANGLGDASMRLSHAAQGISIVEGYRAAGRAVNDARIALRQAEASGDAAQIAAAREQLQQAERAKTGALLGSAASAAGLAADMRASYTHFVGAARKTPPPLNLTDQVLRGASRGLNVAQGVHGGDLAAAGVNALGLAAVGRAAAGRESADKLGLTDAANMADAALGYHQASRSAAAADRAVSDAERALQAARLSGDAAAVAQAEANLGQARRSREGALMGSIGAGDSLVLTAAGLGEKLESIRTTHRLEKEVDRAVSVWQDADEQERTWAAQFLDEGASPAEREAAIAGIEALREAKEAFNTALGEAKGDPEKMRAATEAFERLQGAIETEVTRLASASAPPPAAEPAAPGYAALGTPTLTPTRTSTPYDVVTVQRGMTVWEASQRSGVPVERILEFNAEQGNAFDPLRLQVGQKILVPRGEGDVQFTPQTTEQIEAAKRAALEARRAAQPASPEVHSPEIPFPAPGPSVRAEALAGLANSRDLVRQDEADSSFAFLNPLTWVDTKDDDAKNAARDGLRQAIDRLETVARNPAATDAEIYAALQDKNQAQMAFNTARGVVLDEAARSNFLTPVKELAQDAQDAIHGVTGRMADAIEGSGAPAPLVAAATLPLHTVDSWVDLEAGIVKGATDLVDGVAGLVAHPVETAKGMASLIDRAAQTTLTGRAVEFLAEAAFGKYDSLDAAAEAWKERSDPLNLAQAKWDFTKDTGKAMLSESIEAWNEGKYSEAVGIFLGQSADVVLGAGVLGKGSKAARLGRAAEVLDTAADAERVIGAVERTGRAVDATADAARAADATADATRALRAEGRAAEATANTGKAAAPASTGVEGTRSAGAVDTIAPKSTGRLQPGSPEHRAQRWAEYQARNGELTYEQWSRVYEKNMTRATQANAVVDAYHQRLGWGRREVTIDVEGVPRRLDIADAATRRAREVKGGYQSLRPETQWEILRDQILREKGWDVRWHFDGYATPQLRSALEKAGIPFTGGTK